MRLKIKKIYPLEAALVVASVAFVITAISIIVSVLAFWFGFSQVVSLNLFALSLKQNSVAWYVFLLPLVEAVCVFLQVLIVCWLYNLIAARIGPITIDYQALRSKTHAEVLQDKQSTKPIAGR